MNELYNIGDVALSTMNKPGLISEQTKVKPFHNLYLSSIPAKFNVHKNHAKMFLAYM